jgi:hypothetical protein
MSKYEFIHHVSRMHLKSSSLFPEICISEVLRVWQSERNAPILRLASALADVLSSTSRKGMKMTPSMTFTIHAGCSLVRIDLQAAKRWQGACLSKRM